MKSLKNFVNTEKLNVEELMKIKGAERMAQGCNTVSCDKLSCTSSSCESGACSSRACNSDSCNGATCSSKGCSTEMDGNINR